MSQMQPANMDPGVDILRAITLDIYPLIFDSFTHMTSLTSEYSRKAKALTNTTLKDDIQWIKESIDNDIEKLNNLQKHIKFINAQETITNKNEILTVFNEITDFAQLILLDDLITTLEGVSTTLTPKDNEALCINGTPMSQVVTILKKFSISLKITCAPLKNIERNTITIEDINISAVVLKDVNDKVVERLDGLKEKIGELKILAS